MAYSETLVVAGGLVHVPIVIAQFWMFDKRMSKSYDAEQAQKAAAAAKAKAAAEAKAKADAEAKARAVEKAKAAELAEAAKASSEGSQ